MSETSVFDGLVGEVGDPFHPDPHDECWAGPAEGTTLEMMADWPAWSDG